MDLRGRPGLQPSQAYSQVAIGAERQREVKNRSVRMARRCPQTTTVRFDDRPANRQTHSHACNFGSEESTENLLHIARGNAAARIFNSDTHLPAAYLGFDQD